MKYSNSLEIEDFLDHPIWQFTNRSDGHVNGELAVEPVNNLPATTMYNRFIGTTVELANGNKVFAVLIGIDLQDNTPLNSFIIYLNNKKYMFRRSATRMPQAEQISAFLNLSIEDIFPIKYDISNYVAADASITKSIIPLIVENYKAPGKEDLKRLLQKIKQDADRQS